MLTPSVLALLVGDEGSDRCQPLLTALQQVLRGEGVGECLQSLTGDVLRGEVFRAGKPVAGVLALLAPAKDSANPLDYHAFQTDTDGSFEWEALPPGDYLLIVKEDWFDLEWANPEALRPLTPSGRPVRVEAAGTEKMRIELP